MLTIAAEDIPKEIMTPPNWPQWRVTAIRSGVPCESTFIRSMAPENELADIGKRALRLIGVRGRYAVRVTRYYPWLDPVMRPYTTYVK